MVDQKPYCSISELSSCCHGRPFDGNFLHRANQSLTPSGQSPFMVSLLGFRLCGLASSVTLAILTTSKICVQSLKVTTYIFFSCASHDFFSLAISYYILLCLLWCGRLGRVEPGTADSQGSSALRNLLLLPWLFGPSCNGVSFLVNASPTGFHFLRRENASHLKSG